jgi:hypothetical protein
VAIDETDRWASELESLEDLERLRPGALAKIRAWFLVDGVAMEGRQEDGNGGGKESVYDDDTTDDEDVEAEVEFENDDHYHHRQGDNGGGFHDGNDHDGTGGEYAPTFGSSDKYHQEQHYNFTSGGGVGYGDSRTNDGARGGCDGRGGLSLDDYPQEYGGVGSVERGYWSDGGGGNFAVGTGDRGGREGGLSLDGPYGANEEEEKRGRYTEGSNNNGLQRNTIQNNAGHNGSSRKGLKGMAGSLPPSFISPPRSRKKPPPAALNSPHRLTGAFSLFRATSSIEAAALDSGGGRGGHGGGIDLEITPQSSSSSSSVGYGAPSTSLADDNFGGADNSSNSTSTSLRFAAGSSEKAPASTTATNLPTNATPNQPTTAASSTSSASFAHQESLAHASEVALDAKSEAKAAALLGQLPLFAPKEEAFTVCIVLIHPSQFARENIVQEVHHVSRCRCCKPINDSGTKKKKR